MIDKCPPLIKTLILFRIITVLSDPTFNDIIMLCISIKLKLDVTIKSRNGDKNVSFLTGSVYNDVEAAFSGKLCPSEFYRVLILFTVR